MADKRHSGNRRRAAGFSLIEALVGAIVLTLIVLAFFGAIPASFGYTADNAVRIQAVSAGQEYLDIIRQYIKSTGVDTNLPSAPTVAIDPGNLFLANTSAATPGNFAISPSCTARSLFSFDCTVTVAWTTRGAQRSVQVESYIASQAGF